MIRGTTPTLTFTLPFSCATITKLNVAFSQDGVLKFEKELSSCSMSGNVITLQLSENDTLLLDCTKKSQGYIPKVEIQLRVGCGTERMASKIITTTVERILKDGCL